MSLILEIEQKIKFLDDERNSQDLAGRIAAADRLSTLSYYLAGEVGDAYAASSDAEHLYKSSLVNFQFNWDGPVGKGEIVAKENFKNLYETAVRLDGMYRKMSLKLSQVNVIIEQMRHSNSHLKREYYDSKA